MIVLRIDLFGLAIIPRCPLPWLVDDSRRSRVGRVGKKWEVNVRRRRRGRGVTGQPGRQAAEAGTRWEQTGHFLPQRRGSDHIFVH